ncbi:hypothetical protein LOTGIDRAFT_67184, partial [Lottia gigantea]
SIDCSSRRLQYIPKIYSSTQSLSILDLSRNHLTTIENHIFDGLKVTELNLSFNRIMKIEDIVFKGMGEVKVLDLQFNHLTTLPKAIGNLVNLEELHINHNKIFSAEELNIQLSSMKKFLASGNFFTAWPSWLEKMPFLEELDLGYNPISTFPKNIQNHQWSLNVLILDNCKFQYVPIQLDQLRMLEILDMSYNPL